MADTTTFPPLFKILVDGKSSHGGRLTWSLPTQQGDEWTPGEWHGVEGEIQLCHNGLHVTDKPAQWWKQGATAYFVECEGDYCSALEEQESKIAFRRVRLLRPATNDELFALNVFLTDTHQVEKGFFIASGSATVEASGSATVEAYGSATVKAYGSATVQAYGSATVQAYDSATVQAYDSATALISEHFSPGVKVSVKGAKASAIDRRSGKPVLITEVQTETK